MALFAWTMIHGMVKRSSWLLSGRLPFRYNTEILQSATFVIDQFLPIAGQIAPSP